MSTLTRFTLGKNYLDAMLGSQRSVLNREGIGYAEHENQLGSQLESRKSINMSKPSSTVCFYCCKSGHTSNKCYFKKHGVPKGKYKWIVKDLNVLSNMKGPKLNWVPASSL